MTDPTPNQIGFIGLGKMGVPMARRLKGAGHAVLGFDISADARTRGSEHGVSVVNDLGAAVADSEIVILMLPDSSVVSRVLGDPSFSRAARPGTTIIDMSSSQPDRTLAIGASLDRVGLRLLDAPVSGGVRGAEQGTLVIMVGGNADDVDRVEKVLATFGSVRRAGPLGAGHAIKALNNLLSATHLWATSEAMLAGERFGLDPVVMLEIFNGSSGRSGSTATKWPDFILPGNYASGFGLRLMLKDVRIAVELAAETGTPRQLGEEVLRLWEGAAAGLPDSADHTEVARWIADQEVSTT